MNFKFSKKFLTALLVVSLSCSTISYSAQNETKITTQTAEQKQVKNVIMLIPDGASITHFSLSRWYKGGTPLAMDEMACGLVRTYSADAAIADSAPAGTAMATGFKSHTGYVAVLPDIANMYGSPSMSSGDEKKPLATILEAAK